MRHSVTLERGADGGYMAWVHELPGCFARAATREDIETKIPLSIADFLTWARGGRTASLEAIEFTLLRMRALARSDRGAVTQAEWSGAPRPEAWTARKAARRLVWHERLHLKAIRRLLARRA